MKSATNRLMVAMGSMAAVVVAVVIGTMLLGGSTDRALGDDLLLSTRVVELRVDLVTVVGRDAAGDAGSSAQANLDVIELSPAAGEVVDVFEESPDLPDPLFVVRDPLRFGSIEPFRDVDRLVLLLQPLLTPTRDRRIEYSVRLVGLDADHRVVASDWEGDGADQLETLLEWGRGRGLSEADSLARAVRAVVDPVGAPEEAEILAIVGG